jgi:hypothetical protein
LRFVDVVILFVHLAILSEESAFFDGSDDTANAKAAESGSSLCAQSDISFKTQDKKPPPNRNLFFAVSV